MRYLVKFVTSGVRSGWVALAVALAMILLVAPAGVARTTTVAATGVITGPASDGYFTLTIRNTGDESIRCFRLVVPSSVKVVSARSIPNWQLGASSPPPAPDIGARALGSGLAPGQSLQLVFRTDPPYPASGGALRVSGDCVNDVTAPLQVGEPKPKPEPKPCACKDLKARIVPNRLLAPQNTSTGMRIELLAEWTLVCVKGSGKCTGQLELVPSARAKRLGTTVGAPAGGKVTCQGACAKTTKRFQKFVVTSGPQFGAGKRGRTQRLLRLELKRVCKSARSRQIFQIVFAPSGAVDTKASDLNANGIADGKEKKR